VQVTPAPDEAGVATPIIAASVAMTPRIEANLRRARDIATSTFRRTPSGSATVLHEGERPQPCVVFDRDGSIRARRE
jgi:hypothetical protein